MKKNLLLLGLLLIIGFQQVIAQGAEITGTVIESETNLPLIGVNIMIKGTTLGTVTDLDGNYTLSVPDQDAILVFSFIGFQQQEIPVNNLTTVNVTMIESTELLDEVMVVAYGTTKKASFTGAASNVDAEDIGRMPVTSFEKALAGNVAGVQIANNTGQPGSGTEIRIRGRGSFSASNEPLYVIDGIPAVSGAMHSTHGGVNPGNVMSTINPGDIENITVLKDAAASSLYGSRAANGVILITTKQGKAEVTKYAVKGYYGISDFAVTNYEGVTGDEFIMLHRESMENYWGVGDPRVDEEMIKQNYVKPEGGYTDCMMFCSARGKSRILTYLRREETKRHIFLYLRIFLTRRALH
jgi:TonB-dependent SusC/RagA subfamily outer membrane receptor